MVENKRVGIGDIEDAMHHLAKRAEEKMRQNIDPEATAPEDDEDNLIPIDVENPDEAFQEETKKLQNILRDRDAVWGVFEAGGEALGTPSPEEMSTEKREPTVEIPQPDMPEDPNIKGREFFDDTKND